MMRIMLDQSKTRIMEMNRVMQQLREMTDEADEDYSPLARTTGR